MRLSDLMLVSISSTELLDPYTYTRESRGDGAWGSRSELEQVKMIPGTTILSITAPTSERANCIVYNTTSCIESVPTVTFSSPLHPEALEPSTSGSTFLDSHSIVEILLSSQSP